MREEALLGARWRRKRGRRVCASTLPPMRKGGREGVSGNRECRKGGRGRTADEERREGIKGREGKGSGGESVSSALTHRFT